MKPRYLSLVFILCSLPAVAQNVFYDPLAPAFYEQPVLPPAVSRVFPVYGRFCAAYLHSITRVRIDSTANNSTTIKEYNSSGFVLHEQRDMDLENTDSGNTTRAHLTYISAYSYNADNTSVTITTTYTTTDHKPHSQGFPAVNTKDVYVLKYNDRKLLQKACGLKIDPQKGDTIRNTEYTCIYDSLHRLACTCIAADADTIEKYTYREGPQTASRYFTEMNYNKDTAYADIMKRLIPEHTITHNLQMFDDKYEVCYRYDYNDTLTHFVTDRGDGNRDYIYTKYPERMPRFNPENYHSHDYVSIDQHREISVYTNRLLLKYRDGNRVNGRGHAGWYSYFGTETISLYAAQQHQWWKLAVTSDLDDNHIKTTEQQKIEAIFTYLPNGLVHQIDYHDQAGKKQKVKYSYN